MTKARVAVNGFGRIGRAFFKAARGRPEIEVVAVNDLGSVENLAYLLAYDSVYGRNPAAISFEKEPAAALLVDGTRVRVLSEPDPAKLPWRDLAVDVVVEATGAFASYAKAKAHLDAGAKRVVISAPVKDDPPPGLAAATVLVGVNEEKLATCDLSSNASCTTNAGSPLLAVLDEGIGVAKAVLNTVHGYTGSQSLVDAPNKKDFRRGRAGAQNIIPSTTGAAIATTKALPALEGKFDGIAIRVPVPAGSLVDVTFLAKRPTSASEVNDVLRRAAADPRWKGILAVTEDPIVSSDVIGDPHASIADLSFTRVVGGDLVKVLAWYDNELGYAHTLVAHVAKSAAHAVR